MLGSPLKITKENKKIFIKSTEMVIRNGDLILFDKKDNEFNLGNIYTYYAVHNKHNQQMHNNMTQD